MVLKLRLISYHAPNWYKCAMLPILPKIGYISAKYAIIAHIWANMSDILAEK